MENANRADNLPATPHISGADNGSLPASRICVLYIDQTPVLLDIACKYLEREGDIMVDTSMSVDYALNKMRYIHYDLIITDYNNADVGGNALLRQIRSQGNPIPFIYFVLFRVTDLESEAEEYGGVSVVDKINYSNKSSFQFLSAAIREAFQASKHQALTARSGEGAAFMHEVNPL